MTKIRVALLCLAWESCGLLGAAGYRASLREFTPALSGSPREAREMAGMSLLFSLTGPVVLVMGAAISGGFQDGFENPFSASFWQPTP